MSAAALAAVSLEELSPAARSPRQPACVVLGLAGGRHGLRDAKLLVATAGYGYGGGSYLTRQQS